MDNHLAVMEDMLQADTPYADTLGGRLGRAREARGLTSAELARRLGVTAETALAWESDRSEPRANRLSMLAGLLGVSPAWLISGVGPSPRPPAAHSLDSLTAQLARLKDHHREGAAMIERLEAEIRHLSARS